MHRDLHLNRKNQHLYVIFWQGIKRTNQKPNLHVLNVLGAGHSSLLEGLVRLIPCQKMTYKSEIF